MRQDWASESITEAAGLWHDAGCSLIPIRPDGTKAPMVEWAPYMRKPMSKTALSVFLSQPSGIGVICGKVSGNLEMLELEGRATTSLHFDAIFWECQARGVEDLLHSMMYDGYAEWTPNGGLHFFYRISDHEVPGNTKVARRPATEEELAQDMAATGLPLEKINKVRVLAETRGEGGYSVVAPTTGICHPSGEAWTVAAGTIGTIRTITWDQREQLHAAFHAALDQMPPPAPARPHLSTLLPTRTDRPGDHFNNTAQWDDILTPHGWQVHHRTLTETYWTRPGKPRHEGYSATTGRAADADRLYVFSSSTPFEPETPYTKFAAYTLLEHNGDHSAAARALRAAGHGSGAAPVLAGTFTAPDVASRVPAPVHSPSDALSVPAAGGAVEPWRYEWAPPTITGERMMSMEASYRGAAEVYAEAYGDTFKYSADLKKWFMFNGKVWQQDSRDGHEAAAVHLIAKATEASANLQAHEWEKWVKSARNSPSPASIPRWARSHWNVAIRRTDFDQHPHLITLDNGVYDLDTHTYTAGHNPKNMLTKQIHLNYDKDAEAPLWTNLLETLLPDPAIRGYLQRAVGATLLGTAGERALFLLHGDPGTGKSQVVRVLEQLFGDYAATANATAFNDLSKKTTLTNEINDLRGKRFVAVAELDEDERLNEALLKRLSGGDTAKSRGLYQENAEWRVEFTLWMVTNFLPKLSSDDAAMWRRVKPIRFNTVVAGDDDIKNYGDKVFASDAAGILNWALEGVRLYQEHGLKDLPQITEAVHAYQRDVDQVAQFLDEAITDTTLVADEQATIPVRHLHGMYQEWCRRNGQRNWLGERRFGRRIESMGYHKHRQAASKVWIGIGIGSTAHGLLGSMNGHSWGLRQ